jgi:hypothetical protein
MAKKKILKVLPRRLIGVPLAIIWQPPPAGLIKVNWDGSINKDDAGMGTCIGMGCVARDHAGNFLGAKSTYQQIVVDPKVVEVMAALNAVQFCKEVGFLDVMFEGDASQVIREVNSGPSFLSRFAILLKVFTTR